MSEIEPTGRSERELAPKHVPQMVVPVPLENVRDFVADATHNTTLTTVLGQYYSGWMFFDMKIRVAAVDEGHTRIELDVTSQSGAVNTLLYPQRRSAIDRFFVALQDELDRRTRWSSAEAPPQLES